MSTGPLKFGSFELIAESGVLLCRGEPLLLGQRATRLLKAFLERPGEVLTKSDLIDSKQRSKVLKALEKKSGARVFPISAPLEEGMEPLLDAIIQRLGTETSDDEFAAADERHWSPL